MELVVLTPSLTKLLSYLITTYIKANVTKMAMICSVVSPIPVVKLG